MAITQVGAANIIQTSSLITPAFGVGWAASDIHLIRQRVKANTDDVAADPSGYTPVDSESLSGPHVVYRASARILQPGDVAPTIIPPGGVALEVDSITLRGCRNDTIANALEAIGHTTNSSSTTLDYPAATITTPGCAVLAGGTYGTSGAGTLGTPTTLSGGATQVAGPYTGANLKATLWLDIQTSAANISAGNIPITGGSTQTQRGNIIVLRPQTAVTQTDAGTVDTTVGLTAPTSVELLITGIQTIQLGLSAIANAYVTRSASLGTQLQLSAAGGFGEVPTLGLLLGLSGTVGSFLDGIATAGIQLGLTGSARSTVPATLTTLLGLSGSPTISDGTINTAAIAAIVCGLTGRMGFSVAGMPDIALDLSATGSVHAATVVTEMRLSFASNDMRLFFRKS